MRIHDNVDRWEVPLASPAEVKPRGTEMAAGKKEYTGAVSERERSVKEARQPPAEQKSFVRPSASSMATPLPISQFPWRLTGPWENRSPVGLITSG